MIKQLFIFYKLFNMIYIIQFLNKSIFTASFTIFFSCFNEMTFTISCFHVYILNLDYFPDIVRARIVAQQGPRSE